MQREFGDLEREPGVLETDAVPVRTLEARYLEALSRIDRKIVGRSRREYPARKPETSLRDSSLCISLAALVDGQVAGFLMGSLYYGEFGLPEPVAILDTLEMDPDLRHRHVASALLRQQIVVEGGLQRSLAGLKPPLAFLDFETVNPAIPAWPGCRPYEQVPVQFSCHVLTSDELDHYAWLADGAADPREEFARALVRACAKAKTIVAYNAPFERRCVHALSEAVPALRRDLDALSDRIRDLLPVVRDHIYHPDFGGSFSLKDVLPALVPGLGYEDLTIQDGGTASSALEALLLGESALDVSEREKLRRDLLRYCERDTFAMVRLHERLRELAGLR